MKVPNPDFNIQTESTKTLQHAVESSEARITTFDFLIEKHERELDSDTVETMKRGKAQWEKFLEKLNEEIKTRGEKQNG